MKTILILLTLMMGSCSNKEDKDKNRNLAILYLLNEQNKKTTQANQIPRCDLTVTNNGQTTVNNAPFITATTTNQNFLFRDNITEGVNFQYYSVIRITANVGTRLIFEGIGNSIFSPKIFPDSTNCSLNYSATGLNVGTLSGMNKISIYNFSQAGTYLVAVSVQVDGNDPAIFVRFTN